jgi:hypothetical protein
MHQNTVAIHTLTQKCQVAEIVSLLYWPGAVRAPIAFHGRLK